MDSLRRSPSRNWRSDIWRRGLLNIFKTLLWSRPKNDLICVPLQRIRQPFLYNGAYFNKVKPWWLCPMGHIVSNTIQVTEPLNRYRCNLMQLWTNKKVRIICNFLPQKSMFIDCGQPYSWPTVLPSNTTQWEKVMYGNSTTFNYLLYFFYRFQPVSFAVWVLVFLLLCTFSCKAPAKKVANSPQLIKEQQTALGNSPLMQCLKVPLMKKGSFRRAEHEINTLDSEKRQFSQGLNGSDINNAFTPGQITLLNWHRPAPWTLQQLPLPK